MMSDIVSSLHPPVGGVYHTYIPFQLLLLPKTTHWLVHLRSACKQQFVTLSSSNLHQLLINQVPYAFVQL